MRERGRNNKIESSNISGHEDVSLLTWPDLELEYLSPKHGNSSTSLCAILVFTILSGLLKKRIQMVMCTIISYCRLAILLW